MPTRSWLLWPGSCVPAGVAILHRKMIRKLNTPHRPRWLKMLRMKTRPPPHQHAAGIISMQNLSGSCSGPHLTVLQRGAESHKLHKTDQQPGNQQKHPAALVASNCARNGSLLGTGQGRQLGKRVQVSLLYAKYAVARPSSFPLLPLWQSWRCTRAE